MANGKRTHILHKNNCSSKVRKHYTSKSGVMLTLLGKYGFEWSIVKESKERAIMSITTYPDRTIATREYNNLCKSII